MITAEVQVEIKAPVSKVWATLMDVERWHEWTKSIQSVTPLEKGPLALGSRYRIVQPKLSPLVWEVVMQDPGKGFAWIAQAPGLLTRGEHWVISSASGGVVFKSVLIQKGFLAPVVNWFLGGLTRRYMEMEAQGLRQRSEAV